MVTKKPQKPQPKGKFEYKGSEFELYGSGDRRTVKINGTKWRKIKRA